MEAALAVTERVTPLHGASEAHLGRLSQPTCDAEAAEAAATAEDRTAHIRQPELTAACSAATGLEQALQDKVQQQAVQLQQQAALLRDALRHGELCEARLLAAAATAAAAAATAGTAGTAAATTTATAAGTSASRASSPKRRPPPRPVSGEAAAKRELREIHGRHAARP